MITEATPSIYIKDQSLSLEVDKWIKGGGVIGSYKRPEKKEVKGHGFGMTSSSHSSKRGFDERKAVQKPLLEKFYEASIGFTSKPWSDLVARMNVAVSTHQVRRTFTGQTTMQKLAVWKEVERVALIMIEEFEK